MDKERKKQLKNQAKKQQSKKEKNQRNIMLSNVFTIIAVIVGILLVIGIFGETAQLIGLIILAFAIAWLLLYTVRSARKTRQEKKEYLEKNAGKYQSKMNNRTGEITLFSFDYPSRGTQRWTVSNSAITIFEKDRNTSRTIPMSQISSISSQNNMLSFKVSGQSPTMIGGTNFSAFDNLRDEQIFFAVHDGGFVKEIINRVANFSSNQTVSPPPTPQTSGASTVDELAKLRVLLDDGTLNQEEFEHKKRKLLGMD